MINHDSKARRSQGSCLEQQRQDLIRNTKDLEQPYNGGYSSSQFHYNMIFTFFVFFVELGLIFITYLISLIIIFNSHKIPILQLMHVHCYLNDQGNSFF